jgi:tRNA threonylcarbamoyl adenosine modification protein YeaZ
MSTISTTQQRTNPLFLGIQGSYKRLELALFKGKQCLDVLTDTDIHASSLIIPYLKTILDRNRLKLEDISFLSVDNGPGAFTSLRVIISTVNSLAFATGIKLIGVDGLDAVAEETIKLGYKTDDRLLIALLNAYNNDVYHAVYSCANDNLTLCDIKGYKKIDVFVDELVKKFPDKQFLFTGNGVSLLDKLKLAQIKSAPIEVASAEQIGFIGLRNWELNNVVSELQPIYLKEQTYAVRNAH